MGGDSKYTDPRLEEAFDYAVSVREQVKAAKKRAREHPAEVARRASEGFDALKRQLRARVIEIYDVDVADPEEALKTFKAHDYPMMQDFLHRLNM